MGEEPELSVKPPALQTGGLRLNPQHIDFKGSQVEGVGTRSWLEL